MLQLPTLIRRAAALLTRPVAVALLGALLVVGGVTVAPLPALAEDGQSAAVMSDESPEQFSTGEADAMGAQDVAPTRVTLGAVYQVGSSDELKSAVEDIISSGASEASLVLTADVRDVDFVGVSNVKIMVSSEGDAVYAIDIGSRLAGDLVLDNVRLQTSREPLYACGHRFETTDAFEGALGALYGGGPKDEDVSGGTELILRGGTFSQVYGGGKDSNVGGSVHIIIDDPDFRTGGTWDEMSNVNNTVGSLYGGGYAKETRTGCVAGDVTIEVRAGAFGGGYGGGYNDVSDAYESDSNEAREPASVAGTVTLRLGYEGAPAGCVWPGRAMFTHAGSLHSTVGNVRLEVLEGTSMENDGGDRDIFGCGLRDTVRGTVEIMVRGAWMGSSFVYGCGDDSADARAQNAGPVRVLNEQKAAKALSITLRDGHGIK